MTKNDRYYRRVKAMIQRVKWELGCAYCGYDTDPRALEWDHINGGGGHGWSRGGATRTLPWLLRMLADSNIQLLCGNCHNIKSSIEKSARFAEAGL